MRYKLLLLLSVLISLTACNDISLKPNSTGAANEILVVIDDSINNSAVGDSLFAILNQDVPGLNQSEPYFNISRTNTKNFADILKPARNIIIVNINNTYSHTKISHYKDQWSKPQSILKINGFDIADVANTISKYEDEILQYFIKAERKRSISYQTRYSERDAMKKVKDKFGFSIVLPKGMNRFKNEDNFMWIANSSREVNQNIVIYTYPYTENDAFTREKILHKRDSVMMLWIPGPSPDSYMGTEYRYNPPIARETSLENGNYAMEVRGLWTAIGDIMGGPFVSISCLDEKNQQVVTVEAFVYAPNKYKRNIMRQLEAILYTINFETDGNK